MREIKSKSGEISIVDDDDFERVSQHRWYYSCGRKGNRYFAASAGKILLHRFIMNAQVGTQVDHLNGNKLDNRKKNLRICSNAQNNRNKKKKHRENNYSEFKGVTWNKKAKKFQVGIRANGTQLHLGLTNFEIVAARVYDHWAKKFHGEYARLNNV